MTNPNTDLTEQIDKALWGSIRVYDHPSGRGIEALVHAPVHEVIAAILPVVERAVRRGQAEALRKVAPHLNDSGDDEFVMDAADQIEKETSDEH